MFHVSIYILQIYQTPLLSKKKIVQLLLSLNIGIFPQVKFYDVNANALLYRIRHQKDSLAAIHRNIFCETLYSNKNFKRERKRINWRVPQLKVQNLLKVFRYLNCLGMRLSCQRNFFISHEKFELPAFRFDRYYHYHSCLYLLLLGSAAVLTLVTSDNIPKFEHSLMLDDEITPARARTEQITGGGHDGQSQSVIQQSWKQTFTKF